MSAFVVRDKTLNRVLSNLSTFDTHHKISAMLKKHHYDLGVPQKLGEQMRKMNVDAVKYRYQGRYHDLMPKAPYQFRPEPCDIYQCYKSLRCWLYQCSEGKYPETPFFMMWEEIAGELALRIVDRPSVMDPEQAEKIVHDTPQWEKAEWD